MQLELKPNMNDFFVRGIPLNTALYILKNWEALTEAELESLGFTFEPLLRLQSSQDAFQSRLDKKRCN